MFQLTLPPLLATCSPINGLLKLYAVIPSSFFIYFPRSFLFCHLNVFIGYLRHQLVVHGCFNSEVAVYSCRSVGAAPLFFIPSVKMQSRFPRTTLHHTVHECTASPVLLCSIKPGLAHFCLSGCSLFRLVRSIDFKQWDRVSPIYTHLCLAERGKTCSIAGLIKRPASTVHAFRSLKSVVRKFTVVARRLNDYFQLRI